jgi:hypothetical protein
MRERYKPEELRSNYASYQIDTGQLNREIETLERGRALLCFEMLGNFSGVGKDARGR